MRIIPFLLLVLVSLLPACASAELVVIANPGVGVTELSASKTATLFLVPGTQWPNGTPVVPVDMKSTQALKYEFYERVSGRNPGQLRAYWARQIFTGTGGPPLELTTPAEIVDWVSKTPGAIGYVPKEYLRQSVIVLLSLSQIK